MPGSADFERLDLLFRRSGTLPALPSTAVQLVKSIDSGEASAADLERIIAADPALSAEFLRMASVASAGGAPRYSSIRGAIMLLGQRTVRSLAMSLLLRHMTSTSQKTNYFDPARFSRHSLAVAILARFLFARKQLSGKTESNWSIDEIFAVGLLSSLGIGLLSRVAPEVYERVFFHAKRSGVTLEHAFQSIFGRPTTVLTAAAVEAWELPPMFSEALEHLHEPWADPQEFAALCCLNYAVVLSDMNEMGIGDWPVSVRVEPEVDAEAALTEEEIKPLIAGVQRQVADWVHPSGRAA